MSLINFTAKYSQTVQLISLTIIFYTLMACVFAMHFIFMVISILMEREVYKHFLFKKCCEEDHPETKQERVGYRADERLYIYVK